MDWVLLRVERGAQPSVVMKTREKSARIIALGILLGFVVGGLLDKGVGDAVFRTILVTLLTLLTLSVLLPKLSRRICRR